MTLHRRATAYPAGTGSQSALPAAGVPRVPPIDGFTARSAFITVKSIAAVEADKHMIIPGLGIDMDRAADQADRRHFRLVPDAVALFAILFEKALAGIPVNCLH